MSEVLQGPVIPDWDDDPGVPLAEMGFAWQLQSALYKLKVHVEPLDTTLMRTSDRIETAPEWKQFNVRKSIPNQLASRIHDALGKSVQFGVLPILINGVEVVEWLRSRDVWVRRIVAYRISRDDFQQRWDVLVRAK